MTKTILVTGGAGYIGSNVVDLLIKTHKVIVVDNLSTGHKRLLHPEALFYELDILDKEKLQDVFKKHSINTVLHLAAFSSVGESEQNPEKYFKNNVEGSVNLLEVMLNANCKKIIFSSSAAVYGKPKYSPIDEEHPLDPISVYGETKAIIEERLHVLNKQEGLEFLSLRYFNAGGSSEEKLYGEIHEPETHLIPSVLKAARAGKEIHLFGNDYATKDGTCIRDYVHVTDIAQAHVLGIDYLEKKGPSQAINLGTERGFSVKEILALCEETVARPLKVKVEGRRKGDPPTLVASNKKAANLLNWRPQKTIRDIIESAWRFEQAL